MTSTPLLSLDDALERIKGAVQPIRGNERIVLNAALGRTLAEPIHSPVDVPAFTNSAMDGYAVLGSDLPAEGSVALRVIGTSSAGHPFRGVLQTGQTVRIMTGAVLPQGADTVVMQEHVERDGEMAHIGAGHRIGQHVRHAGEDLAAGQAVLEPGRRLTPADLGSLASLGFGEVSVRRRLRVAFFSTGDELRSAGEPLAEGEIYDSNRYTLHAMLTRLGVEIIDMGVVRDRREAIEQAFHDAAAIADTVITSGGASVGEADYVSETLAKLGRVDFWKIAIKPGKPLAFGTVGDSLFFGLPGNPVSAMVTFYQLVQPALLLQMGQQGAAPLRLRLPCSTDLKKRPGRTEFQRGLLQRDGEGRLTVAGCGAQGSHILSSMSRADCFIVLPADSAGVQAGELVEVQPFAGLV